MTSIAPTSAVEALVQETAPPAQGSRLDQEPDAAGLPPPLGILDVPLGAIRLTALNPRADVGDLTELQASLGSATAPWLVQFPAVMDRGDGTYELIFGHRRYQAAQAAGWLRLRCVVWPILSPLQIQRMRLLENSHRRPLSPLEQAAALQVLYYLENATALGCGPAAVALLAAPSGPLADKIAPLQQLLQTEGWQATRPPVPWPTVLDRHGIDMSPAARKRLLAVLNVEPDLRPVVAEQGLSASSIRALGRLPGAAQHQVMAAVEETPAVATKIRRIARVVARKGYSLDEALDEARGPGRSPLDTLDPAPDTAGPDAPATADLGLPALSAEAQADVTELLGVGNRLAATLTRLQRAAGNQPITTLPAPWGDYIRTGLALVRQALESYEAR